MEKPITWQTFPDRKAGGDQGYLTKIIHGSLKRVIDELQELNAAGAGVFVTVNETDLQGRSKGNIKSLRACWADLDDKDTSTPYSGGELPLQPTIQVKSGHGTHFYWGLEPLIAATQNNKDHQESILKDIQRSMAHYGADSKVCEVARVMRMPGFYNMKAEPFPLVALIMADGPRYDLDAIQQAFPPAVRSTPCPRAGVQDALSAGTTKAEIAIKLASEHLATCAPAISGEGGHNTTLKVAIQAGPGFDLDEATTYQLLRDRYNPRCQPEWSEKELQHKVTDAFKKESRRGWMLPGKGVGINYDPNFNRGEDQDGDPTRPCFSAFRLNPGGLFRVESVAGKVVPIQVSDPFQVLAEVRDPKNSGWGIRVSWADRDGIQHARTIPREAISGDGSEVIRLFVGGGLRVNNRRDFLAYLAGVTVPARARSVEHIGWQQSLFVLPDDTIGTSSEQVFLDLEQEHNFRVAGTLVEWKNQVGRYGRGNSRLAFAICVGFSAALIGPLRLENGGFNIFGRSSTGKTTCAQAAGSIWGGPTFSETWRATSNGLEAIAVAHNDALLVLDEQGQADPKECGEIIYMLGNGVDKVRATKTLENRARRRWRVTYLSTGEVTLADKLREIGMKTKAGQSVRLVDIPVCPEGRSQAFEDIHGMSSSQALANHLKTATQKFFGTPIREFLRRLSTFTPEAMQKIKDRMRQWTNENVPKGSDPQVGRVADRFALTAVAGELATAWHIVPWAPGEADRAATACFRGWLTHRGGIRASEHHEAVQSVLDFIDRHGQSRFMERNQHDQKINQMAGWRDKSMDKITGTENVNFMFTPSGWQEACEGYDAREVARAMLKERLLDGAGGQKAQKKVRIGTVSKWLYVVLGSAIVAYRDREVHSGDLFPWSKGSISEGTPCNLNLFFDSLWMFPRSLGSIEKSEGAEYLSAEEFAAFLGGRIVERGEDDD